MDIECCEKLLDPNSNQVAVKRDTWNLLDLDIQLDVYRALRAYDLYKKGINVSRQWRNTIERHKGTLPKFRQLTDCRALNKLAGDNYEDYFRRIEEDGRRRAERALQQKRRRENHILIYTALSIIGFIAAVMSQLGHISAERMVTTILLLAVTLKMGEAYEDLFYYPYYFHCCGVSGVFRYGPTKQKFFRYIVLVCLVIRAILFVSIGILRRLIQADNLLDIILWSLHLPELIYLLNWSITVLKERLSFRLFIYHYTTNVDRLKPVYPRRIHHSKFYIEYLKWYSDVPIHINTCAWALVIPQFLAHLQRKLLLKKDIIYKSLTWINQTMIGAGVLCHTNNAKDYPWAMPAAFCELEAVRSKRLIVVLQTEDA
ncbi:hypothetical protein DdX_16104 [Ditylenchus destructor]|uniref:Uncharacterized protein n=1 Tax=Ditylenchus destructor TaxID=166010 RepID=A0AAD4QX13_9BILA|nr:hypothetical protein DdX_16104 [Ditylenchus destructor]